MTVEDLVTSAVTGFIIGSFVGLVLIPLALVAYWRSRRR